MNEENGEIGLKEVEKVSRSSAHTIYSIQINGDVEINTTAYHQFYLDGEGWVSAINLKVADRLLTGDGIALVTGIKKTRHEEKVPVFNFSIKDWVSYFVTKFQVYVHNEEQPCSKISKGDSSPTTLDGDGARYGERKISDELYKDLRGETPSTEIRDMVNKDIKNIIGSKDPALGEVITDRLEADHIVPMNKIVKMDGFEKLTKEQQLKVLNNPSNFIGLTKSANTSKGAKSFEEWIMHKGKNKEVDEVFRKEMIKREQSLEKVIQQQIDEFKKS